MSLIPFGFWKAEEGIVLNNLIVYYDAANSSSYTSGASTWYDLTANANNSQFLNNGAGNPILDAAGGGSVSYLNSSDHWSRVYISGINGTTPDTVTVEFWIYIPAIGSHMFVTFGGAYDIFLTSNGMGYNTFNGDQYGIDSTEVTNSGIIGNFRHIVMVVNQNISYTNNKIYVNSVNKTLSQIAGSENATNRTFDADGQFTFNGYGSFSENMKVSIARIYNRELTSAEILQNYNTEKSRFGL